MIGVEIETDLRRGKRGRCGERNQDSCSISKKKINVNKNY
mgnify:CR=1 FL=1